MKFDKDEAVRLAEETAGIIDAGWMQGDVTDGQGNYCAVGALKMASHGTLDSLTENKRYDEYAAVYEKAKELLSDKFYCRIDVFNDDSTTTQADVSDLFRKVAKELAAGS